MNDLRILFCVVMSFGVLPLLAAEDEAPLNFETQERQLQEVDIKNGHLAVEFGFRNSTQQEVQIESVRTTCSCASAASSVDIVPPGGTGAITLSWDVGHKRGDLEKQISVKIKGLKKPTILSAKISLPLGIQIGPEKLTWQAGVPGSEKLFALQLVEEGPTVRIDKVMCSHSNFSVIYAPGGANSPGSIKVLPFSTGRALRSIVEITGWQDESIPFRLVRTVEVVP